MNMNYIYLLFAMTFSATITVAGRLYNSKNDKSMNVSGLYTFLVPTFASVGWVILWCGDFSFDARVLPYSVLYGIGYSCFTIGVLGALKVGSTSLTALVKQVALVGVTIWGFAFWDTAFTAVSGIGIVLIVVSLSLCLITKEKKDDAQNLPKWMFFALLIALGNAGCSIVQRYQQMAFDYQHKNMFMLFGVLFAAVVCLLLSVRENKKNWGAAFKSSWMFPAMAGCSSALSNVFVLLPVKHEMSPVIIYPGVAVGGLMLTIVISLVCFREKLRIAQWFGLAVGAVALVLLNI
jgi:uncharacterized membrane protein